MLNRVTAAQVIEQVVSALGAGADASEVLATLLGQVRLMLEADEAYVLLREGRRLRLRAAAGLAVAPSGLSLAWGEGVESLAMTRGEPVVLVDASRHAEHRDPFGRPSPVGAMVACPMLTRGEVVGVIVATRSTPGRFGGSDLWWVDLLGGLAAVVVENERVRRAQEYRARQAEVLLDVVSQSGGDADGLLQKLADTLTRDLDVNRVDVLLAEKDGRLVCFGTAGAGRTCEPLTRTTLEAGPLVQVLEGGQPFLAADLDDEHDLGTHLREGGMQSALAVPIAIAGRRRGVLLLANQEPEAFGPEDQAFALVLAARVGVLLEEAELRQRRAELERAEAEMAARQDFVGVVSHELKTPVAVIQAYTDLLLRRAERSGDDANVDVLKRMGEQVERMLHMVDQTLDLQRLAAGMMLLELSHFDLAALTQRVVEEMGSLSSRHRLVVEAREPVVVAADRRRIEEVLANLLQNAIKYSPDGGEIRASVAPEPEKGRAVVSVSDQGIGISAEEQSQVFERFYQGKNRLYEGHVGLGLGLYISRELVRRHGGEISLRSEPGLGSTFSFWLPVAGPDDES